MKLMRTKITTPFIGLRTSSLAAFFLAFATVGTPDAPGVALIPTVGGKSYAGGCGMTIHGCGRDSQGNPCGVADGITCIYDEVLSLYDVNDFGDWFGSMTLVAEQNGWTEAWSDDQDASFWNDFVEDVIDGIISMPREHAETFAEVACKMTGANIVSFQVHLDIGAGGAIQASYYCNRWTDVD